MIYPDDNIHDWIEKVALSPALKRRAAQKAMERAAMLEKEWIKRSTKAKDPAQSALSHSSDINVVQNAAARRRAQRRLFAGEGRAGDVMGRNPRGVYAGAQETKSVEKGLLAKNKPPTPSSPAPAKGISNLALGGGALAAGAAGYGLAKMSHVYSDDNIHEALEKVAARSLLGRMITTPKQRNVARVAGAALGGAVGYHFGRKMSRRLVQKQRVAAIQRARAALRK